VVMLTLLRQCAQSQGNPVGLRVVTVHTQVVVLLGCPFVCLSHVAAAAPAGTSLAVLTIGSQSGCDCCSGPCPGDRNGCPAKPDSRQGGGTCLCHGAVVDRQVVSPDPGHAVVTFLPLDAIPQRGEPFTIERGFPTERVSCHFPAADSGREVRALIASLLL
jgi:hypothetical protein